MKGITISFDGPDGGGKTTVIQLLAEILVKEGFTVHMEKEHERFLVSLPFAKQRELLYKEINQEI